MITNSWVVITWACSLKEIETIALSQPKLIYLWPKVAPLLYLPGSEMGFPYCFSSYSKNKGRLTRVLQITRNGSTDPIHLLIFLLSTHHSPFPLFNYVLDSMFSKIRFHIFTQFRKFSVLISVNFASPWLPLFSPSQTSKLLVMSLAILSFTSQLHFYIF